MGRPDLALAGERGPRASLPAQRNIIAPAARRSPAPGAGPREGSFVNSVSSQAPFCTSLSLPTGLVMSLPGTVFVPRSAEPPHDGCPLAGAASMSQPRGSMPRRSLRGRRRLASRQGRLPKGAWAWERRVLRDGFPLELGPIGPDGVHHHGKFARHRHQSLFVSGALR